MKLILKHCLLSLPLLVLPAATALADDTTTTTSTTTPFTDQALTIEDNFRAGNYEIAVGGGALYSPIGNPKNRPTINYAVGEAQFGLMLTTPSGDGFFRGNFEFVPEGFGAGIFEGPGQYIAGATLWIRYNFVPQNSRFVPFAQLGAGFVFTDIDHRFDGQNFNFDLAASLGLRFFVTTHTSLNLEYRFEHISNANLGKRNLGVNAHGPVLSFSYYF